VIAVRLRCGPIIPTRVVIERHKERKYFFLKKETKTFCGLTRAASHGQEFIKQKFFVSFFSKKNDLLAIASRHSARLNHVSTSNPVGIMRRFAQYGTTWRAVSCHSAASVMEQAMDRRRVFLAALLAALGLVLVTARTVAPGQSVDGAYSLAGSGAR